MDHKGEVFMLSPRLFQSVCWLKPYIEACRIERWVSWIFGFVLGNIFFNLPPFNRAITVFVAFSSVTASIFVINQYFDRYADEKNEEKSNLPIASGRMLPQNALVFSGLLITLCFFLISITDIRLLPSFSIYITLWIIYSAPSPRLKSIPILDFLTSGLGAGFLPFFIGLNVPHQTNINTSLIILATTPLTLFHCGAHIIQTIGDYEADQEAGINTFVVKYGKEKGITIASLMFFSAFLLFSTCVFLGIISPYHLILLFLVLPLLISPLLRLNQLYKNPCSSNVIRLQKSVKKNGVLVLLIALIYVLMLKLAS